MSGDPRPCPARPPHPWWGSRLLGAALIVLVQLIGGASPAQAPASLVFTTPPLNATVADSPTVVRLAFDEPVTPGRAT